MGEHWFGRKEAGSDFAVNEETGEMLMGAWIPDMIRLPPELGGQTVKVLGTFIGPCPSDDSHDVTHYKLDHEVQVAECPIHKCLWYKINRGENEER